MSTDTSVLSIKFWLKKKVAAAKHCGIHEVAELSGDAYLKSTKNEVSFEVAFGVCASVK